MIASSSAAIAENDLLPSITTDPANATVKLIPVATGLAQAPTDLVPVPGGSGRLFVTFRGGDVHVIDGSGTLLATPFLSMANLNTYVVSDTDFTSIAFHPDFAATGQPGFAKFYTLEPEISTSGAPDFLPDLGGDDHHDVLYEYTVDDVTANAFAGSRRELLRRQSPQGGHNLDDLVFDSNGLLWISSGDGGHFDVIAGNAPLLTNPYGKILRIDPLGLSGSPSANNRYSIPPTNPFVGLGGGVVEEIFASGLRNPYRMNFDRATGDLWIADVGSADIEEVDRIPAGSPGGENFAWNRREGSFSYQGGLAEAGDVLPVFEYDHQDGATVIGGFVYRVGQVPELAGMYVFADFQGNRDTDPLPNIARLLYGDPATGEVFELNIDPLGEPVPFRIFSIGEDAAGELYVLGTMDDGSGEILRSVSGAQDPSLQVLWTMDDGIGPLATDSTLNANDATLFNGPSWTAGSIGGALDFDGVDDYAAIADADLVGAIPSRSSGAALRFTISAWIRLQGTPNREPILVKQGEPDPDGRGFVFEIVSGGNLVRLESWPDGAGRSSVASATSIVPDVLYHVAVTYDTAGGGTAQIYVNGAPDGPQATNYGGPPRSNSHDLSIGRYFWSQSYQRYFNGTIDDLAIWNRPLTPEEIQDIYLAGLNGVGVGGCGSDLDCDDGDVCNGAETCDPLNGCQPGTIPDCDDFNPCTVDSCDAVTGCVNTLLPADTSCSDGDTCNGLETCDATGACLAGTPLVCDNGDACDGVESCDPTLGCQAGTPPVCDNGDACDGVESCDPALGCQAGTPPVCDNGDACDGVETCDPALGCQSGTAVNCYDGDPCTDDTCDAVTGLCDHAPIGGCLPDVRILPVVVLVDPATTPGTRAIEPASAAYVPGGVTHWLEFWASDVGVTNTGVSAAYVDVSFCPDLGAEAIEHSPPFTMLTSGIVLSVALDDVGGSAPPDGDPANDGVEPDWVRIGWARMIANPAMRDCQVSIQPSAISNRVAALARGLIPWDQIELGSLLVSAGRSTPGTVDYDLDGDDVIGPGDLALMFGSWMTAPPADPAHDLDCDGAVGESDVAWLMTGWLKADTDPSVQYSPDCP